jgi:hypothetical protein
VLDFGTYLQSLCRFRKTKLVVELGEVEGEYFQFSTFANGGNVVCMVNGGNVSLTLLLNLK